MDKNLTLRYVLRIARELADILNISLPNLNYILKQMGLVVPMPVCVENDEYQIWLTSHYIAYSSLKDKEIHYVYITKHHIKEEYQSYLVSSLERRSNFKLPDNLYKAFFEAMYEMMKTKKDYFVTKMKYKKLKLDSKSKIR